MPRGTRRTSYVRDGRGRFASTPGGGAPKRPTLMYGPGRVVRVNKKTVSYYSEQTGSVINVDKSWVKAS